MILLLFFTALTVIVIGLVIYSKVKDTSDEIKLLRQDVFKVSVDLAKLQSRLDDLV